MKKYIPFIPIIGAIIVAYNPSEDYGLSNKLNHFISAILQAFSFVILFTYLLFY